MSGPQPQRTFTTVHLWLTMHRTVATDILPVSTQAHTQSFTAETLWVPEAASGRGVKVSYCYPLHFSSNIYHTLPFICSLRNYLCNFSTHVLLLPNFFLNKPTEISCLSHPFKARLWLHFIKELQIYHWPGQSKQLLNAPK